MIHRFRYVPDAAETPRRVALAGETSDWRNAIALSREDDGAFACTLGLAPGVYQTKLIVDDEWRLDPSNARTRSERGQRNSLIVIDGAPEPWLFAAAEPWVTWLERGGLRVLVGVRKPVRGEVWIANDRARVLASPVFEEDEHVFFSATVPVSSKTIALALETEGAPRFEATIRRGARGEDVPAWWRRATIYGVFVDRFRPAVDRDGWEIDPGRRAAAGGHLDGIRRSLDELADLGVDTLYLTPVHVGASVHRYDVVDPLTVDPALGGEAAYDALARDARTRGMRIVQDLSFAHAGRGFPAYEEVLREGRAATRSAWFQWRDDALVHYGRRTDAPLFDLGNPEVQGLVLEAVAYWARRGASGLRLDMTAEVPIALGRRIRRRFRELVPDGVVLGEVVPLHAWRWRAEGVVDAATDFAFHELVTGLVCDPRASAEKAFADLARTDLLRGGDARIASVRFLSTHDHPRLATLAAARGGLSRVALGYAILATMPGVPMLLYGEEVGMRSDGSGLELEDVWPDRAPMPWSPAARDPLLRGIVRALFRARAESPALREGSLKLLFADASTLVYRREADGDVVDVALNFAPAAKSIALEDDENPRLVPIATTGAGVVADGATVVLPPCSAIVARRERVRGIRARKNLVLRDHEFTDARPIVESRPTRFFFSVTERCNLRCAHCITYAPERTKSGEARTMTPSVLDALRDDLALGDYFAFVHGGESMTAPIFWDALEAIRTARAGEPYVAHLLTNGVLFGPATAQRLVRAGVSSVSVSLDGATAATNDAIREGGRFDDVVTRLRDVVSWRRGEGIDLRLGLSFVVLAQNVRELDAFVELGAAIGVDWIKLEEGVPATEFAKRSLVSCAAREVRSAIDAAMARGRERGIVMVDHTRERALFRCRLDDEARAFLEADEHANRGEIHPCRTPWETVCIEPNGDVRVLDFFGPIVGNVTRAPLGELWNAPDASHARERSRLARICGAGPVVCLSSGSA